MVEAKIFNLAITDKGFVVILKPVKYEKVIPISIAFLEAQSIMSSFIGYKIERPLTHDILGSIFLNCDIKLINIIIDNVLADTFFAKLVIEHNGKNIFIDARPSDAIAMALKLEASIFIEEHVIEKSGIIIEESESLIKSKNTVPFTYKNFDKENIIENKNSQIEKEELEAIIESENSKSNLKTKEEIQKLLDQAVKEERYEDAAKYRDELDNLEQ